MNLLLNLFITAQEVDPEFDTDLVTPGPEGFTFIVIIAIAASLLIVDMTRRIRRNTYRGIVQEELIAEAEAAITDSPAEQASDAPEVAERESTEPNEHPAGDDSKGS